MSPAMIVSLLKPLCCRCHVTVIVPLSLFLLLPFLLSSSPFGVILAAFVAIATVVAVALSSQLPRRRRSP